MENGKWKQENVLYRACTMYSIILGPKWTDTLALQTLEKDQNYVLRIFIMMSSV